MRVSKIAHSFLFCLDIQADGLGDEGISPKNSEIVVKNAKTKEEVCVKRTIMPQHICCKIIRSAQKKC